MSGREQQKADRMKAAAEARQFKEMAKARAQQVRCRLESMGGFCCGWWPTWPFLQASTLRCGHIGGGS